MKKIFWAVLAASLLTLPVMRTQTADIRDQSRLGLQNNGSQTELIRNADVTNESANYADTVTGVISNSYGDVSHVLFSEGLYYGTIDSLTAFTVHEGDGSGTGADDLKEDLSGGDSQAIFWRWQMRAAAGAHDAIIKITAKADAQFAITHAAPTAVWATASSVRIYAEDTFGIRKLIQEVAVSATTNVADCFGKTLSLKNGQKLYIDYHYSGDSGYGVVDFCPTITADTTAYAAANVPDFSESAEYWDSLSAVIANSYNDVSHTLFSEGLYYGKLDSLTKFTAHNGDGSGTASDQLVESTTGGDDQVMFWRWQMRCTASHDAIIKITALKDAKFTISHAALPTDTWATFTSIKCLAADTDGTTVQLKDKAVAANTAADDYGVTVSLKTGNILYIDYYSNGATGTCSFAPKVTADANAFDATAVPDFATAKSLATKKTTALADLKTAYDAYDSTKYTTENYTALTKAYNDGIAAINAAADEAGIKTAYDAAIAAMAAVTKAVENVVYWDSITAVINNNYKPLESGLLTYGFYYGKITDLHEFASHTGTGDGSYLDALYVDSTKGTGQAAFERWQMHCSGANDAIIKITAKADMQVAVTNAATTAVWATNTTVRYYAMDTDGTVVLLSKIPVSTDTSANHFACTAYLKAGQTLFIDYYCSGAANDYGVVDFCPQVEADTTKFDATKVSDFAAEKLIDDTRTAELKVVNDAYASYKEADYTEENWAQIVSIKDDALAQLNNCYVAADMKTIGDKAVADMAAVQTIAQANAELDAYRTQKTTEAKTFYDGLKSTDYSASDWAEIQAAYTQLGKDLTAATSKSKMNVLVLTFESKVNSYQKVSPTPTSQTSNVTSDTSNNTSDVSTSETTPSKNTDNKGLVIGLSVGIPVVVIGAGVGIFFLLKKKKPL